METVTYGAGVFTIPQFLSPEESQQYITESEAVGYVPADVRTHNGAKMLPSVRNNDRVIFSDLSLAAKLFDRIRGVLPEEMNGWRLSGLNEQFRFYRYSPGQFFKWHRDGGYTVDGEESFLTLLLYLNGDYEGGETEFKWDKIKPTTGLALVFPHKVLHQGAPLVHGTKYVLRTDVMYSSILTSNSFIWCTK